MTILSYVEHEELATHHVALEKLKDFALARGWTVLDWQTNVRWAWSGSQYDFIAGSESFLMLQSAGYGAQTLHFRLRGEAAGTDPNHEWVQLGSQPAGSTSINHASSDHPVQQSAWNLYRYNSFKPVSIPKMWIFGNDKFLMAVTQMNSIWCNILAFGTVELFDTADDEGQFCGYGQAGSSMQWYEYSEVDPFLNKSGLVYYDGAAKIGSTLMHSMASPFDGFFAYMDCTLENAFSEVRPEFQGLVYVRHNSDSLWRILGTFPVYRVDVRGYQMGEIATYGSKKFVCFPSCKLNDADRYYGLAVRIV